MHTLQGHIAKATRPRSNVCLMLMQNRPLDERYEDSRVPLPRLQVDLYTGPQASAASLEICTRPDGSPWLLGEGACGRVYKVRLACWCSGIVGLHCECISLGSQAVAVI